MSRHALIHILALIGSVLLLLSACRQPQTSDSTMAPPPATATTGAGPAPTNPVAAASATAPGASVAQGGDTYLPLTASGDAPTPAPTATATPEASPTAPATPTPTVPPFPTYEGPALPRSNFGMQIHLHREELDTILGHIDRLGFGWVKVQVAWKVYEPQPGEYEVWRFQELDHLVSRSASANIRVLLSVAKAPEWSRATTEADGPPQDYAHFQQFMEYLAWRYQGNVAAYELWNEPNLQREWAGEPLSAARLVELIRYGAAGVRAGDSQALVVSAAPATTGINDGVTAIDDRVYLRQMLDAGVGDIVDAVGVHPYGWANPPDASVNDGNPVAPSHNNHRSFFFGDTMRDYRAMLEEAGHAELPLWLTEFGWGSFEGFGAPPPAGAEFMSYVSEWKQAQYTLAAYELANSWDGVGPLFLWNLNFAPTLGPQRSESGYSVLRPDGSPRPVYYALQTIPKE